MSGLKFNAGGVDYLQRQAQELLDASQFQSIQWQLQQGQDVLSAGSQAVDSAILPTADSLYRIYSMTKPIVSFVALQLVSEGKLSLDDKLSRYIPAMSTLKVLSPDGSLADQQSEITIEHLLTHTAGFSYDFLPDCSVAEKYREVELSGNASHSLTEVIGMLTTFPLASQPGATWRYSVATDVLAHVLENVSGLSLPELLSARVFTPAGMADTAFHVPDEKLSRLQPMFGSRELGQVMAETDKPNELVSLDKEMEASHPTSEASGFYRGGHGLYSSMSDYLKFMHVLKTGKTQGGIELLPASGMKLMWGNQLSASMLPLTLAFNVLHGYGWCLMGRVCVDPTQCEAATAKGEGGWAGAASTYFFVDRENDLSMIVLTQYIGSTPSLGGLMHHAAYSMFTK